MEVNIWNFSTLDQTNWHAIGGILVVTHFSSYTLILRTLVSTNYLQDIPFIFENWCLAINYCLVKKKKYYITLKFECLFK